MSNWLKRLFQLASPEKQVIPHQEAEYEALAKAFLDYAGNELEKWRQLKACEVIPADDDKKRGLVSQVSWEDYDNLNRIRIKTRYSRTRYREWTAAQFFSNHQWIFLSPKTISTILPNEEMAGRVLKRQKELEEAQAAIKQHLRSEGTTDTASEAKPSSRVPPSSAPPIHKQPSGHKRGRIIQQVTEARGVKSLLHFTPITNLPNILKHGLLPTETLKSRGIPAKFTDSDRHDGCLDACCLSIGFPNYSMFYKYAQKNQVSWVVLEIKPSILWEFRCAFCVENAASSNVTRIPIHEREGPSAFKKLFQEQSKDHSRSELDIPDCYPTDPQAEVCVFGCIPVERIKTVHYCCPAAAQRVKKRVTANLRARCTPEYFGPRQDYKYW